MKSFADITREYLPHVQIKKIGIAKDGHGYIKLPNQANCDKALNKLKEDFNVKAETRQQREFLPKITVFGIDEIYTNSNKADLIKAITDKNPLIQSCVEDGKTFEVLFVSQDKNKENKAVIKVHADILQIVRKLKYKIYVDCGVCRVNDRFFLNQCYRCQHFGHRNNNCPKTDKDEYVCRYCSGAHKSSSCTFMQSRTTSILKCANCSGNHCSTDHTCPILQKQLDFVLRRTMGMEDVSKNSIPRHAIVT